MMNKIQFSVPSFAKVATVSFVVLLILRITAALDWNVISIELIDIKPGAGLQEVSASAGKHTCTFSYKAQGGTKETWDLQVERSSPSGRWKCGIKRPGASYLFFEEFMFEISSGHLQSVHLESRPGSELPEIEYTVDPSARTVRHNPGRFRSQLNSIEVEFSNKPRKEREL